MDTSIIAVLMVLSLLISYPIIKEMRNKAGTPKEAGQGEREGLMIRNGQAVEP